MGRAFPPDTVKGPEDSTRGTDTVEWGREIVGVATGNDPCLKRTSVEVRG